MTIVSALMKKEFSEGLSLFEASKYLSEEIEDFKDESLGVDWPDSQIKVSLNYDEIHESLKYVIEAYDDQYQVSKGNAVIIPDDARETKREGEISLGLEEVFDHLDIEDRMTYTHQALMETVEDSLETPVRYKTSLANLPETLKPFSEPL